MQIISVVRDFKMYDSLVRNNTFNKNATFHYFDNNIDNKFITTRYNEFLDNYDYSNSDWFIFCHEDWEILEDWEQKFENLDKNSLYGPIGVALEKIFWKFTKNLVYGQIKQSTKTGDKISINGIKVPTNKQVTTFDCQCLIVHSDIINKYNLRFDENLSFDLYVEDFCINSKENYNIDSKILQLDCQHYSWGKKQDRFFPQFEFLKNKYAKANKSYSCTCMRSKYFGEKVFSIIKYNNDGIRSFFYQNTLKNNKKSIKICRIPIYIKRIA